MHQTAGGGLDGNDASLFSLSHLKPLFDAGMRTTHIVKQFCSTLTSGSAVGARGKGGARTAAKKSTKVAKRMDNKSEAAFVPECLRLVEAFNVFVVESAESLNLADLDVDVDMDSRREDANPFVMPKGKTDGDDAFRAVSHDPHASGGGAAEAADTNGESLMLENSEKDWIEAPLHSVVRREVEAGSLCGGNTTLDDSDSDSGSSGSETSSGDEGLGYVSEGSECSDDDDSDYEGSDSDDELAGKTLVVDFSKYKQRGRAV